MMNVNLVSFNLFTVGDLHRPGGLPILVPLKTPIRVTLERDDGFFFAPIGDC